MSLRIAGVYWIYSDSLSQFSCQNLITIGYCSSHFFQLKKFILCRFFIYSLINAFQILQEFLLIFGAYIFDGITNLMYDTKLFGYIWINTLDCLRKTFQAVYTSRLYGQQHLMPEWSHAS